MEKIQERVYQPKEAADIVGITTDLLRKWTDEFNIQVEKTEKGHRRYVKANIEELIEISKRIKDQNWSWDQVRAWKNGEHVEFNSREEKSNLEKKLDQALEMLQEEREARQKQEEFNLALVQKLASMEQYIQTRLPNRDDVDQRDRQLMLELRNSQQEKIQKEAERKRIEELERLQERKWYQVLLDELKPKKKRNEG